MFDSKFEEFEMPGASWALHCGVEIEQFRERVGYYWGTTGVLLVYYWGTTGVLLGDYWGTNRALLPAGPSG